MKSIYGNNVNEFYVWLARENYANWQRKIESLDTREKAEAYLADIKQKISSIFKIPSERTPLLSQVTQVASGKGYKVESLYFFSRPGYPVTANFYLPEHFRGKIPGVLFLCGHAREGKASKIYSTCCVSLARKGFAVLIIDPIEQGERRQYKGFEAPGHLCGNHNLMGIQQALVGEWLGAWRVYDGIRATDYLQSRPEVDGNRLYLTGNSGGGTLTTWLGAVDPRFRATAPSCYITSWKRNIENEIPADIEQMPPRAFEYGMEMGDFLLAHASHNLLVLGQKDDMFDARGTKETYEAIKPVIELLGGHAELFIGPDSHGYYLKNREAMYKFFTESAFGKQDGEELEIELMPPEKIYAASGSVTNIQGNRFLREFTAEKCDQLLKKQTTKSPNELKNALIKLLNIEMPNIPKYRVLRSRELPVDKNTMASRFGIETEDNQIMAVLYRLDQRIFHLAFSGEEVKLKIAEFDSELEATIEDCQSATPVFSLDVRSIGEMQPSGTDMPLERDFFAKYHFDYHYASLAIMHGKPMVSGKVYDILSVVELLSERGAGKIKLVATGLNSIPAVIAALLSDKVTSIKINRGDYSFANVAKSERTDFPLSSVIPGILEVTDFPEILNCIKDKLEK